MVDIAMEIQNHTPVGLLFQTGEMGSVKADKLLPRPFFEIQTSHLMIVTNMNRSDGLSLKQIAQRFDGTIIREPRYNIMIERWRFYPYSEKDIKLLRLFLEIFNIRAESIVKDIEQQVMCGRWP